MVVLDNPLGLGSKKSLIKIKPPAIIALTERVSSFLMSTKNKKCQATAQLFHHGSLTYFRLWHHA